MLILAIETSCDETSIAILKDGKEVLSNIVSSQIEIHKEFGGVVPELASRHHIKNISAIMEEALETAKISMEEIDYIAVTYAPGLIGALLVGISFAKGLAYSYKKPLIPVHHIKGHIYSNFIENKIQLPAITLVVSGGHTNIVYIDENHKFTNLGGTLDDAIGESYDKVARVLGLGYPGGPVVDKLSKEGNPKAIQFKEANVGEYDFSFSGLKTAVINFVNNKRMKEEEINIPDLTASFQEAAVNVLVKKAIKAAVEKKCKTILIAGGVAANSELRKRLFEAGKEKEIEVFYPKMEFCTDNAAMIAAAAYYKLKYSEESIFADLNLNGKATLSIEED
ncbi:MAG: tRNA (adenosine(37)-N6)-threonylcarbamoyltransferase complex transferase subunit TsaD [Fusobacteriaceae bacterium]|nr:tRNA (adenosine(37)-N6)-threonylcarbamoyltransferase complex transferase subunit TsaD [Fusobacteriaceae bacterium]MBN2838441.1 tRNA (adenosine(37)-N6)-threonylcarbamoyltransferase complex transferase subunit TsaD [Fusobacteriaceae bacterium]